MGIGQQQGPASRLRRWCRLGIVGIGLATVGLALVVASGMLDRLSHDGKTDQSLAWRSLGIYWFLSTVCLLVVGNLREYWRQILLLAASTCFAIGTAEVVLRLVSPALRCPRYQSLPSTTLHHVLPAGKTMYFGAIGSEHIYVKTNSDGLRSDYEREPFKQADVRIACLGDSFTFGYGVQGDRSYPAVLEELLQQQLPKSRVAVLNAGVTSYSPLLEDRLLRRVVRHYQPQVVMLMVDCTDIGDDHQYAGELKRVGAENGNFPRDWHSRREWDLGAVWRLTEDWRDPEALKVPFRLLGRLVNRKPRPVYDYYSFRADVGTVVERNRFFIFRHPLSATRPFFDRTWDSIQRVAASCEEIDARLVVVVAPRFHHWNRKECPRNWEESEYLREGPHQFEFFRYFAERSGKAAFDVQSLLPQFQATEQFPLVFDSDPHWNADGHRFVAEALSALLVEELQVFTSP